MIKLSVIKNTVNTKKCIIEKLPIKYIKGVFDFNKN
jgi:hypothetical protein